MDGEFLMLVLSRKTDETVVIGEGDSQVVLVITRISGNRVTLGLQAARHVKIIRGELDRYEPGPQRARPTLPQIVAQSKSLRQGGQS
jgi:carbon storage regulator